MFGFNGVVFPEILKQPLSFLQETGVTFGEFLKNILSRKESILSFFGEMIKLNKNIVESLEIIVMITIFFFVSVMGKNSIDLKERFEPSIKNVIIMAILLSLCLLLMIERKEADFLYFNF